MAVRTFVKDPETGALSTQVSTFQKVELDELARAYDEDQRAVEAKQQEVAENTQAGEVLSAQLAAAEARLSDSKSELESAKAVVEQPTGELDEGSVGTGSESTDSDSQSEDEPIADL